MSIERARRWPPRQRIHLTPEGEAARSAYQQLVQAGRAQGLAATALDAQLASWAADLGVRAGDGILLDELGRPLSVGDLARALETCGLRAPEVKAGVDRLYGANLVQPPQPAPPPPREPWR